MAFDTWESYFYSPPHEGTLRNPFDERDAATLSRLEYVETADRQRELLAGEVAIARTYDADHVRAIHRRVTPEQWNQASMLSRPDMLAYEPVPDSLVPVFRHLAVQRTSASVTDVGKGAPARSLHTASYSRGATEASHPIPEANPRSPRRTNAGLAGPYDDIGRGGGR